MPIHLVEDAENIPHLEIALAADTDTSDARLDPSTKLAGTLGLGIVIGLIGGVGSIVHRDVSPGMACLTGIGLFAGVVAVAYIRPLRRLAELLSSLH